VLVNAATMRVLDGADPAPVSRLARCMSWFVVMLGEPLGTFSFGQLAGPQT